MSSDKSGIRALEQTVPGGRLASPQLPGYLVLPVGCFSWISITSVSSQLSFHLLAFLLKMEVLSLGGDRES